MDLARTTLVLGLSLRPSFTPGLALERTLELGLPRSLGLVVRIGLVIGLGRRLRFRYLLDGERAALGYIGGAGEAAIDEHRLAGP